MKINLLFILAVCMCLHTTGLYAQDFSSNAEATFETTDHDFGTADASAKVLTYTFKVKNTGTNPLIIFNAKPSCGCTSASWTKKPIAVGEKGEVVVNYSTTTSLGKFHKTITVSSNAKVTKTILNIQGEITTTVPEIQRLYHFPLGQSMGMKKPLINFNEVFDDTTKTIEWEVANFSNEPQTITLVKGPPYIKMKPITIKPKGEKSIPITFISSEAQFYDANDEYVTVSINHPDSLYKIRLFEIRKDDPKKWQGHEAEAPKLEITNNTYNWNTVTKDSTLTAQMTLTNTGKSDLMIRQIYKESSHISIDLKNRTIKAGESQIMTVTYKPQSKLGEQQAFLRIITNSPTTPKVQLVLKCTVKLE